MADKKDDIVLSIRGMSKSFGRNRVLDHINLDVKRGTVMGLMGENGAGKSTMMKCLFGTYQKDEGNIFLNGKEVSFSGPKDALENGIAMVHQELNQCLERNVIDNLFLGRYPVNSMGVIDEGRMKKEAAELFRKLGMTVNLTQPMGRMSVSQRQMCEIAKAISYNSRVIVLDEPTSSLTVQEVDKLFEMMRMLKEQGIALIYISHKMDEIFEICDEISVLRDGNLVMTKSTKDANMNELIAAMVGRSLDNRFPPVDNTPGDVILSIQNLSTKFEPHLQDVSFDVKEGEIFGLYGLVGAGRTELLETIFGVRTRAAGRVYFNNRLMNFSSAKEAMDHGFAMITEERKANGLFLKGDLTFNTTIANLQQYMSVSYTHLDVYKRQTMKPVIQKAKEYIMDNYQDPDLSVEKICRQLHMSPAYFSTMFKKETGQAYTAYLTQVRLDKAVELLNKTDDKTYVIAAKVGYQEQNYFSYVFKKRFGVSPTKFRGVK